MAITRVALKESEREKKFNYLIIRCATSTIHVFWDKNINRVPPFLYLFAVACYVIMLISDIRQDSKISHNMASIPDER